MKQRVILFGASNLGKAAYEYIKDKYNVIFFCDNDKKKWGKSFYDTEVKSPEILREERYKEVKIIITSMYSNEIYQQLIKYSIKQENIELSDFKIQGIEYSQYEDNQYKSLKNAIDNFRQDENYNLHIMIDNFYCKRFIGFVNQYFNPKDHKFIILSNFADGIKYVDNVEEYNNVEIIYYNKYTELKLYFYVKNSKRLFIHYLTDYMCKFICDYEVWNETELNWIVWGGDLYEYIDYELYDEQTKKIISNIKEYQFKSSYDYPYYHYREKCIRNCSNILGIKQDYNLVKRNFITNANHKTILYPNPVKFQVYENLLRDFPKLKDLNKNDNKVILVGNSGDPSNNHLDILRRLGNINNENVCIIAPLAYGNDYYIQKIIKEGTSIFGKSFIPIKQFLNSEDYFRLIQKVDVAIMNHNRQQAYGNISLLLYLNKKVFIKENNPLYEFLKELDLPIYSIDKEIEKKFSTFYKVGKKDYSNTAKYFNDKYSKTLWQKCFE